MISMPDGPRQYEEGALKGLFLRYLSGTRKELQNIVQLIQSYCRLAELEITSEERSRAAIERDSVRPARRCAAGGLVEEGEEVGAGRGDEGQGEGGAGRGARRGHAGPRARYGSREGGNGRLGF